MSRNRNMPPKAIAIAKARVDSSRNALNHWLMALAILLVLALVSTARASLPNFADLADDLSPAVVKINTTGTVAVRNQSRNQVPPQMPDIFRHFFGEDLFDGPFQEWQQPQPRQQQRPTQSLGSGFIISDDGYIVTNSHVVENADFIEVTLVNGDRYDAVLIGRDPRSDLAVLKIEAQDLPMVHMGDSDDLRVGEWVLAIGSPFDFDYSVTAGIVSAKGRSLPNDNFVSFIQTDVAINPGNSGGPLFNLQGEVVGINSQIFTRSGGFMGLSFAIPSNLAVNVIEQIKNTGTVSRGRLGVVMDPRLNNRQQGPALAEALNLPRNEGALISRVEADSAAEKAGIHVEDVIVRYNGQAIRRYTDLAPLVSQTRPGDEAIIELYRNGERISLTVVVDEVVEEAIAPQAREQAQTNILRAQVRALTEDEKMQMEDRGVFVEVLMEDSPALRSGLQVGDLITSIAGRSVTTVSEFEEALAAVNNNRTFAIRVVRDDMAMFLAIQP